MGREARVCLEHPSEADLHLVGDREEVAEDLTVTLGELVRLGHRGQPVLEPLQVGVGVEAVSRRSFGAGMPIESRLRASSLVLSYCFAAVKITRVRSGVITSMSRGRST